MIGVAILTISSSRVRGEAEDRGGPALADWAREAIDAEIRHQEVIDDDASVIAETLARLAARDDIALILTTGGTGLAPRDVTPEATRAVIEREVPGIPEAMRSASRPHTEHWMLSRGVAGVRHHSLIINFPGSPRSIAECGAAIAAAVPHAVALITGESGPETSHVAGSSSTASQAERSSAG